MDYTFFGVQILFRANRGDPLRGELGQIVRSMPQRMELVEKRGSYQRIRTLLHDARERFTRGYWDYISDPSKGEAEWETWCSELEKLAGEPRPKQDGYRSGAGGSVLFTMAFLLVKGAAADTVAAERCDVQEQDFLRRGVFDALVATIPMFNFATVKGDAVYIVPGDDDDGFTDVDLADEGWSYLRPLL